MAAAAASTQTITGGPDTGKTVVQSAQAKGYQYVTDATGLSAVSSVANKPVLGLFNKATCRSSGAARPASLGKGNAPVACTEGQRPGERAEPRGDDRQGDRPARQPRKGFFLQVEGASIDKQDHATNACGQIGETVAFDNAIGVALDYQRTTPTRWSSSPPTTPTRARSSARTPAAAACRPGTRPT